MRKKAKKYLKKRNRIIILSIIGLLISVFIFGAIASAKTKKENVPKYKYYTSVKIAPGDTLWSIASEYCHDSSQISAYVKELRDINRLSGDDICAGRYLTIVYYSDEYK